MTLCARARQPAAPPALRAAPPAGGRLLTEAEAKAALAGFGLRVPASVTAPDPDALLAAAAPLRYPLALKALAVPHKTEAGAVVLGLATPDALHAAAAGMAGESEGFLAEEMVTGHRRGTPDRRRLRRNRLAGPDPWRRRRGWPSFSADTATLILPARAATTTAPPSPR